MKMPVSSPPVATVAAIVCLIAAFPLRSFSRDDFFSPKHRLTAVGASRPELDAIALQSRTARMIEAETFTILRDPHALAGVKRITTPHLQQIFKQAAAQSGFPASTLAAIAYLESFGDPVAETAQERLDA